MCWQCLSPKILSNHNVLIMRMRRTIRMRYGQRILKITQILTPQRHKSKTLMQINKPNSNQTKQSDLVRQVEFSLRFRPSLKTQNRIL